MADALSNQVRQLFKQARENCKPNPIQASTNSTRQHCQRSLQGLFCWPSTEAGKIAHLPCPPIEGFDTSKFAERQCHSNGEWATNLGKPWSDLNHCVEQTIKDQSSDQDKLSLIKDTLTIIQDPMTERIISNSENMKEVQVILNSLSIALLILAGFLWIIVWFRTRTGHPYRYVTFMVAIIFALVSHITGLASEIVETPTGMACRFTVVLNSFANLVLYTFILLYVIFCVAVAMRRLSAGPRFYFIIFIAVGIPLAVVGLETTLDLIFHPEIPCEFLHLSNTYHWFTRAPKTILLFGALVVIGVLFYWLFCFDNEVFKRNRDFLLIRHSSVTILLLVIFCLFNEVYQLAYLNVTKNDRSSNWEVMEYENIMNLMESSRGTFVALLLCFFDLEILFLFTGCPCIPDLRETDIDETWETRIRSESKVRFASGSDPNQSSDDSELRPRGKVKYGTLAEEEEEG